MKTESAIIFMIVIGGFVLIMGFAPFVIVLSQLLKVWRDNRGTGLLLAGVVFFTAIFYLTLFIGFGSLMYAGGNR